MATTETLEQALRLLIEDTKRYRQRTDIRFERLEQSALEVNQALAALSEQTKESVARLEQATAKTQIELHNLAKEVKATTKQVKETNKERQRIITRCLSF